MARNANDLHEDSLNVHQRVASFFADVLGSPYTIYVFALLALISLPAVLQSGNTTVIVSWVTQTFIQLVALAVLQAKQVLDGKHSERVADETHRNAQLAEESAEEIKDLLQEMNGILCGLNKPVDNVLKIKKNRAKITK